MELRVGSHDLSHITALHPSLFALDGLRFEATSCITSRGKEKRNSWDKSAWRVTKSRDTLPLLTVTVGNMCLNLWLVKKGRYDFRMQINCHTYMRGFVLKAPSHSFRHWLAMDFGQGRKIGPTDNKSANAC